jgi:hypothetical protein
MNEPRVAVISLWAEDVPILAHFYRDVIGLKLLPHHGERPHFDVNGVYLTIVKGTPCPAPTRFPFVALAVDDLNAPLVNFGFRIDSLGQSSHSEIANQKSAI